MRLYIGIDLGTSAMKLLLVDEAGKILNSVTKEYPLILPQPGWSEQDPADWWSACLSGLEELLTGQEKAAVTGIGVGGQMHGLVVLDENDDVIRPAILWNDGRTAEETDYLNREIGREKLSRLTANIAFAGFTAPKLLWLNENEPESFARITKIMLPKDFINYKLTGVHACDCSDASGMLLLDVKNRRWSQEMLDICGISEAQMPKLFESYEVIGVVKPELASALEIPETVEVYATTLHYAPCEVPEADGFRVAVVLPKGTNTEKPYFVPKCEEDEWMTARNKWLLAHPESEEAQNGAHIGLHGVNINIVQ